MSFSRLVMCFSVLSLLTVGCQPPAPAIPGTFSAQGDPIATVNGKQISRNMMDAVLRTLPKQVKAQLDKTGDNSVLTDGIITGEVMYQEAIKMNLHQDPLIKEQIALAERNALAEALFQKVLKERLTDARVQQYYSDHLVQFARPELQIGHIVVTDEAQANDIVKQARAGADYAELAKKFSKDTTTSEKGGDIGWLEVSKLNENLREPLSKAVKGDVVGPFQLGPGWHLFKVLDARGQEPLEAVREEIEARLEGDLRDEYMKEIREKAIVVESANAPGAAPVDAGKPVLGADPPAGKPPSAGAPTGSAPAAGPDTPKKP